MQGFHTPLSHTPYFMLLYTNKSRALCNIFRAKKGGFAYFQRISQFLRINFGTFSVVYNSFFGILGVKAACHS